MNERRLFVYRNDLLRKPAEEVLQSILADDATNASESAKGFSKELQLIDNGLVLYLRVLQGIATVRDKVKTHPKSQAASASAQSAFNLLLATRHLIMAGYFPETYPLLRACYENFTRVFAFALDESLALDFLQGRKIEQRQVFKSINKFGERLPDILEMQQNLQKWYGQLSDESHYRLDSFATRTGWPEGAPKNQPLKERVGLNPVLGGLQGDPMGRFVLVHHYCTFLINALAPLGFAFPEETGSWKADFDSFTKKVADMAQELEDKHSKQN